MNGHVILMLCCYSFKGSLLSPWRGSGVTVSCHYWMCYLQVQLVEQINTLMPRLTLFLPLCFTQAGWRRGLYPLTRLRWVHVAWGCFIPVKNAALITVKTCMRPSIFLFIVQEESSSDITSLFPHLDMEPLTSSERYGKNTAIHISKTNYLMHCFWTNVSVDGLCFSLCAGPGALWWNTTCSSWGTGSSCETDRSGWG